MAPKIPARMGEVIQARNTCTTPSLMTAVPPLLESPTHEMPSTPSAAIPNPRTPPRIECVVETGKPNLVASVRKMEEAVTAQTIPSISTPGDSSNSPVLTIFVRMVSATRAPTPIAPENSITEAVNMAWM